MGLLLHLRSWPSNVPLELGEHVKQVCLVNEHRTKCTGNTVSSKIQKIKNSYILSTPPTKPSRSGLSICGLEGGTQSESGGTHRHLLGCVLNSHMAPTMQPRTGPDKSTAGQTRLLRGSLHSYPQRQTFVWYIMLVHILAIYSQRWSPTGERKSHPRLKRIPI